MRRCLLALIFALTVRAEGLPSHHDFLIVVDTSISMADRKNSVLETIRELIRNGFSGQIQEDDVITLWTEGTCSSTNPVPAQVWSLDRKQEISESFVQLVRNERFHRGSHLKPTLRNAAIFLHQTTAALLVVLTDADEHLAPLEIAPAVDSQATKLRQSARHNKAPIVYSLMTQHGNFGDWRAYCGPEIPRMPRLPARQTLKPRETNIASIAPPAATNSAPEPEPVAPVAFNYPPGARVAAPAPDLTETPALPPRRPDPPSVAPPAATASVSNERSEPRPVPSATEVSPPAIPPQTTLAGAKPAEPAPPQIIPLPLALSVERAVSLSGAAPPPARSSGQIVNEQKTRLWANPAYICLTVGGTSFFALGYSLRRRSKKTGPSLISRSLAR